MTTILAYIDPGTGALVLQVLVASVLTAGFFVRRTIARPFVLLRQFFSGKSED